jgi:Inosine-uridine preferring nucleoside hydrolase
MKHLLLLIACLIVPFSCGIEAAEKTPVRIIFDTDIQGDVDDVGSVALLHALADRGEALILGMAVSCKNRWSPLCLDSLNHYFNRPSIPIGVVKGKAFLKPSRYAQQIAEKFPRNLKSAEAAPDATMLYRKILAAETGKEVVIVSVGQLTNIANLLKSKPDQYSTLNGTELVQKHVKAWVCMGCKFPEGKEANIYHDPLPAQYAITHWPCPLIFSGFEIGLHLKTGGRIKELPESSPVRQSYQLFNGIKPHFSWDQTAVLFAVRHFSGAPFDLWKLESNGYCTVDETGRNHWVKGKNPKYDHSFFVKSKPRAEVEKVIEELMLHLPAGNE